MTDDVTIRRVRPTDAGRVRALRLEMLADSPLAFITTLAQAAAMSHEESLARVRRASQGSEIGQFIAVAGTDIDRTAAAGSAATGTAAVGSATVGAAAVRSAITRSAGASPVGAGSPGTGSAVAGSARAGSAVAGRGRLIGQVVGLAHPEQPDTTLLVAVYITPSHRGRGMLGALIEETAAWSRSTGRPVLELEVVTTNARALRAYRRLGFEPHGRPVPHPTIPLLTEQVMTRAA